MAGGSPGRLAPPFRRLTQKPRRQAAESFFVRPSIKRLVYSQLVAEGGRKGLKLPQPKVKFGFYRDIVVLAFPLDESAKASGPINFLDAKLAAKELGGSATDCRFLLGNSTPDKSVRGKGAAYVVRRDAIVNLSSRMSKDVGFATGSNDSLGFLL